MAIGDAWKMHQADPLRRKVAIGDGHTVALDALELAYGLEHFIANQDEAAEGDVNWVHSYSGNRPYIDYEAMEAECRLRGIVVAKRRKMLMRLGRYIWRKDYRPTPAPIKIAPEHKVAVDFWESRRPLDEQGKPFVLLEPFIKSVAPPSKQYPVHKFLQVAEQLSRYVRVYQISTPDRPGLGTLPMIRPQSFQQAMGFIQAASLYIGPEGGLHHAAAAVGTPAVVIFGGFISPNVTGYENHINLTGGVDHSCGTRYGVCPHCTKAFANIPPDEIVQHARRLLQGGSP